MILLNSTTGFITSVNMSSANMAIIQFESLSIEWVNGLSGGKVEVGLITYASAVFTAVKPSNIAFLNLKHNRVNIAVKIKFQMKKIMARMVSVKSVWNS